MREIIFRGKRIDNGEWVYGSLVNITKDNVFAGNVTSAYRDRTYIISQLDVNIVEKGYSDEGCESLSFHYDEVDPSTVGQYIGLKDKKGKEIYHGDKLKADNDRIYDVIWNHNAWRIGSKTFTKGEKRLEKIDNGDSYWIFDSTKYSNLSKLEIIGNIHDENP